MTPPRAWRIPLQRTFTSFPSGSVGTALFVLRVVVGMLAIVAAAIAAAGNQSSLCIAMTAFAAIAGLAMLPGFLTPIAGAMLAAEGAVILLFMQTAAPELLGCRVALFEFVVMAATLAVLGPGAASIDARLYGRREVATSNDRGPEDL